MDYKWKEGSGEEKPFINNLADKSEGVFTFCFTFEAAVKILSMGFILSKGCYLRDAWNWLDFTVVITGLL